MSSGTVFNLAVTPKIPRRLVRLEQLAKIFGTVGTVPRDHSSLLCIPVCGAYSGITPRLTSPNPPALISGWI